MTLDGKRATMSLVEASAEETAALVTVVARKRVRMEWNCISNDLSKIVC